MMKRKSILSVLKMALALSLVFSFAACDTSGDEDEGDDQFSGTALYEINWSGAFSPDFTTDSVKVVNAGDEVIGTSSGAMSLKMNIPHTHTQIQEGGFFPTGTGVNFTTDGGGWNGVFFKMVGSTCDISAASKAYVAIKGDLGETAYFGLKIEWTGTGDNAPAAEVNILDYPAKAGAGGWTVYTINLADFTNIDTSAFSGLGLWNPNVVDGTAAEREAAAANYPALTDVLISVAFGE
ncbi:hypothetical protein K7J14_13580 [Treponema zuelzerae]|uniref:Lipoprotein n=1 Tax=Teretinema zuelzerae TaxID=156 RepID=A0AAE3JJN6_9SPIR|nr:hypothetical protein [Teretinema zuelzerae]MCD1655723.1 hypothetical protein [Teretinema zuelzerae]